MSEMDDVEFLERIVKNNKDFVAGQIASMNNEMKYQISTLEKKLKKMEEENHKIASMNKDLKNQISTVENRLKEMEEENHRLTREIPLQIKTALKECLQAGITGLEDPSPNPETARAPELVDPESSNPEPPRAKRRKQIELISDFEGLSNHLQKLLKPYYKKDRLASHDLLNDIQRAFVKSKANILHENKSIKLNAMLVRQIINEGIEELIWSEGFNPGDTGDFEKYLMTRLKNEKKSLSKKSMLEESALSISSLMSSTLDQDVLEGIIISGNDNDVI